MTIYRIQIKDNTANKTLFTSEYHTSELGPYHEAIDKGWIEKDVPIDKDRQIVPDQKTLIFDDEL